jgi:hypothetical protein
VRRLREARSEHGGAGEEKGHLPVRIRLWSSLRSGEGSVETEAGHGGGRTISESFSPTDSRVSLRAASRLLTYSSATPIFSLSTPRCEPYRLFPPLVIFSSNLCVGADGCFNICSCTAGDHSAEKCHWHGRKAAQRSAIGEKSRTANSRHLRRRGGDF